MDVRDVINLVYLSAYSVLPAVLFWKAGSCYWKNLKRQFNYPSHIRTRSFDKDVIRYLCCGLVFGWPILYVIYKFVTQ